MQFNYNFSIVLLSIVVAIIGSFVGLILTTNINAINKRQRWIRIIVGALALGGSIWSMHFIAMMAVILPVPLRYDLDETIASAVLAVIFTAVAFAIVGFTKRNQWTIPAAGVVMGAAIGGMHYLGMHAIRGCLMTYDLLGVAISVVIAVQAAAIALWAAFAKRGIRATVLGAVGLGLGISSMHYSGMQATAFIPLESVADFMSRSVNEFQLVVGVTVVIWTVWAIALLIFTYSEFRRTSPS